MSNRLFKTDLNLVLDENYFQSAMSKAARIMIQREREREAQAELDNWAAHNVNVWTMAERE
jgi:hypothetical protein